MMEELAAALNGREVTDDEGEVSEERETFEDESATSEQETLEEESATGENQVDSSETDTRSEDDDDEEELAEDESGKKYIPEKRFKSVYAKLKDAERQLEEERQQKQRGQEILEQVSFKGKGKQAKPVEKTPAELKVEALELKMELPQFDPNKPEVYDKNLDDLGFEIYRANPGMTLVQAGRKAIEMASKLAQREQEVKQSAKQVKRQQSDQGITTRVTSRQSTQTNPSKMSLEEMEQYLKETGAWNS